MIYNENQEEDMINQFNAFREFSDLAEMVEGLIEKKTINLNIEKMKFLQEHGYSGLEIENTNDEIRKILANFDGPTFEYELCLFEGIFSQILRRYLFVAAYQSFETWLTRLWGGGSRTSIKYYFT